MPHTTTCASKFAAIVAGAATTAATHAVHPPRADASSVGSRDICAEFQNYAGAVIVSDVLVGNHIGWVRTHALCDCPRMPSASAG